MLRVFRYLKLMLEDDYYLGIEINFGLHKQFFDLHQLLKYNRQEYLRWIYKRYGFP